MGKAPSESSEITLTFISTVYAEDSSSSDSLPSIKLNLLALARVFYRVCSYLASARRRDANTTR